MMLTLLVVPDEARRKRALAAFERGCPHLQCVESDGGPGVIFSFAPERFELIALDASLRSRGGFAWQAHWRRIAPRAQLIEIDADSDEGLERACKAARAVPRRDPRSAPGIADPW